MKETFTILFYFYWCNLFSFPSWSLSEPGRSTCWLSTVSTETVQLQSKDISFIYLAKYHNNRCLTRFYSYSGLQTARLRPVSCGDPVPPELYSLFLLILMPGNASWRELNMFSPCLCGSSLNLLSFHSPKICIFIWLESLNSSWVWMEVDRRAQAQCKNISWSRQSDGCVLKGTNTYRSKIKSRMGKMIGTTAPSRPVLPWLLHGKQTSPTRKQESLETG